MTEDEFTAAILELKGAFDEAVVPTEGREFIMHLELFRDITNNPEAQAGDSITRFGMRVTAR